MIGNDFIVEKSLRGFSCGECHIRIPKGADRRIALGKNGKVVKTLCMSEDCRLEFDNRIWQQFASKNAAARRKK